MKKIPKEVLECFYYDETSPSGLRWNINIYGHNNSLKYSSGQVAGSMTRGYYEVSVRLDGVKYRFAAHRVVYSIHNTLDANMFIDHIDGNRSNNLISNLRVVDSKLNNRNISKRVGRDTPTGVYLATSSRVTSSGLSIYESWVATWVDIYGISQSKCFSISRFGNDRAYSLACEYRAKMIDKLNSEGAGYSDRHGI